jgi:hypothetical protein
MTKQPSLSAMRPLTHREPALERAPSAPSAPIFPTTPPDLARQPVAAPVIRPAEHQRLSPAARLVPRHGRYAGLWAAPGLLAAGYVGFVLINQDSLSNVAWRQETPMRDGIEVAAVVSRTQTEVADLQRTVGTLESDMARVKAQAAGVDAREKMLTGRVAAVESRVETFATTLTQASAAGAAKLAPQKPAGAAPVTAQILNPQTAGAPIETASIQKPDATRDLAAARQAAPPTVVDAGPAPSAVLLASGPSLEALRLSWSLLNERHKPTLKALEPRVVTVEPGSHQLLAGPIASAAAAQKVCATLKARGVACQTADFKGDAL